MKILQIILVQYILTAASVGVFAQNVLATAGNQGVSKVWSLTWTLGEVFVPTVESSVPPGNVMTIGFQQPPENPVSAIPEIAEPDETAIFPNPNNGQFWLRCPIPGVWQLQVFDVIGRNLWSGEVNVTDPETSVTLDLSFVPSGIYWMWVSNGRETHSEKWQKLP